MLCFTQNTTKNGCSGAFFADLSRNHSKFFARASGARGDTVAILDVKSRRKTTICERARSVRFLFSLRLRYVSAIYGLPDDTLHTMTHAAHLLRAS